MRTRIHGVARLYSSADGLRDRSGKLFCVRGFVGGAKNLKRIARTADDRIATFDSTKKTA